MYIPKNKTKRWSIQEKNELNAGLFKKKMRLFFCI